MASADAVVEADSEMRASDFDPGAVDPNVVSTQPSDVLPAHEAEGPFGDPNIPLPGPLGDGHDIPEIDFSFMYRNQTSHDPLWVALDEIDEDADEDDTDIRGLEDSDDELDNDKYIDWAKFEVGESGELSAWDQLGAGYNREFASIGMSCIWLHA